MGVFQEAIKGLKDKYAPVQKTPTANDWRQRFGEEATVLDIKYLDSGGKRANPGQLMLDRKTGDVLITHETAMTPLGMAKPRAIERYDFTQVRFLDNHH